MSTATNAPRWFQTYVRSFVAGESHAFLLHGDVDGTAYEAIGQRTLLLGALAQRREIVAVYRLGAGITLHDADGQIVTTPTGETLIAPLPSEIPAGSQILTRRQRAMQLISADAGDLAVLRERSNQLIGADAQRAAAPNPFAAALANAGLGAPQGADSDPFADAQRPVDALTLLDRLLRSAARVAVVIDYADTLAPALPMSGKGAMPPDDRRVLVTLLAWAKDPQLAAAGQPIFLISRELSELHPDLRASGSGWKAIWLALPDSEAREAYVAWYLAKRAEMGEPIALGDGLDAAQIGRLSAGLSLRQIEDVLLLAAQEGALSRALLKAQKDAIISSEYTEEAEMIDPLPGGFASIGGMEYLKGWAHDEIIMPVRDGRRGDVPKGALLVGPPGTGKSFFVRALAAEVGFNAVAMKPDKILGGIVGESERKLARFFAFVKALAPTLVFLDELDQSDMSRRGNGSGNPVAANLFNAMLQFMSDETLRGKVIIVFASNRPDLLDPALLRFGRMDAIIPVLLPNQAERQAILAAQARSQDAVLAPAALDLLAERSDRSSAADLAAYVRKARQLAARAGQAQIGVEQAEAALRLIRPGTATTAEYYTLLAVNACNDGEHLPPEYAAMLADRQQLARTIDESAPAAMRGGRAW